MMKPDLETLAACPDALAQWPLPWDFQVRALDKWVPGWRFLWPDLSEELGETPKEED